MNQAEPEHQKPWDCGDPECWICRERREEEAMSERDYYRETFGRTFEEHQRGWNAIVEWGLRNGVISEPEPEPAPDPVRLAVERRLERFYEGQERGEGGLPV